MCLAHSNLDYHLRIISNDFIDKLLRKETHNGKNRRTYISSISKYFLILLTVFSVLPDKHNFLHYDYMTFSTLQRYCFDKADDIQASNSYNDVQEGVPIKKLSFSDDETNLQDEDNDDKDVQPFYLVADKIIL